MRSWFVFGILALIVWGFWGFFPKLATNYLDPKSVIIYEILGGILIGIIVLAVMKFKPQFHKKATLFGILTGIFGSTGALFFLFAISQGNASVIVTMTALYPLITIALAFLILKERVTKKQSIGMILAFIAMVLFSL